MQIKQLEDVAGIAFFERIGKRVFLTEAGEVMLAYARQILKSLKEADESLSSLKGLKGGRLAVAVTSTAEYFAPAILAAFKKAQPDVRIRLLIDNREVVSQLLAQNEVDLAIMGRPPAELDAEAVAFAPHPLVVVAAVDHPLAKRKVVTLDELASETMIVRELGSGTRSALEGFFSERNRTLKVGMEMGSNEAIKQAVVAGLGVAMISRHTLGLEVQSGRIALLRVEGTPVMRRWHLVRHRNKSLTPALSAFWDFVLSFAPDHLKQL